jgi:hypothetical protein
LTGRKVKLHATKQNIMTDNNNLTLELYKKGKDSADKFDYFVCSIAGAIFAYTVQTYCPKPIDSGFSFLEPISLLLLAISFYLGMKRIELCVNLAHMDKNLTASLEAKDSVVSEQLKIAVSRVQSKGKRLYIWRDKFLIFGFAAIFLAKVLQPYECDFSLRPMIEKTNMSSPLIYQDSTTNLEKANVLMKNP